MYMHEYWVAIVVVQANRIVSGSLMYVMYLCIPDDDLY